jgi:hypothetical protein
LAEPAASLKESESRLLVLPYGSAFPEDVWEEIYQFLQRGANLLVLGGKPFTRSGYRDKAGWHLRDHSTRFARSLMIDQYQETPGFDGMEFQANPKLAILPSPQNLTDEAWRLLMKYVDAGGNLLITGPVERDEHWQVARRAAELKIDAQADAPTCSAARSHRRHRQKGKSARR